MSARISRFFTKWGEILHGNWKGFHERHNPKAYSQEGVYPLDLPDLIRKPDEINTKHVRVTVPRLVFWGSILNAESVSPDQSVHDSHKFKRGGTPCLPFIKPPTRFPFLRKHCQHKRSSRLQPSLSVNVGDRIDCLYCNVT